MIKTLSNFNYLDTIFLDIKNRKYEGWTIRLFNLGGRWSGKTDNLLIFANRLITINNQVMDLNVVRYEAKDVKETWDTINQYQILGKNNETYKYIAYGNNKLRTHYYKTRTNSTTKKLGANRLANRDIQLIFFEEVSQFENKVEINDIKMSLGGANTLIEIYASNPWLREHWYVQDFEAHLQEDEELLKEKGYQFKVKCDYEKKTLNIYHRTNNRINSTLSSTQLEQIKEIYQIDPERAKIIDLGMCGVLDSSIYSRVLNNVKTEVDNPPKEAIFLAGIDWGQMESATTCVFGWTNQNRDYKVVENEYYHSNSPTKRMGWKSEDKMVEEVLDFLKNQYEKYKTHFQLFGKELRVYIDNAAYSIWNQLNALRQSKYPNLPIVFTLTQKWEIKERIRLDLLLMSRSKVFISDKCFNLWKELRQSTWIKKGEGYERKKVDDHCLDAFEYAFSREHTLFSRNTKNELFKL